jgi:hypothetical protein
VPYAWNRQSETFYQSKPYQMQEDQMKSIKLVSMAVVLIVLAGHGCAEKKFSSGTYTMSQITFAKDECNLKEAFSEGSEIQVMITDKAIAISFGQEATLPRGTIIGNSFTALAAKDSDTIPGTNCEDKWSKKMTGTLTRENVFTGAYEFSDETVKGTDCSDEGKIGFKPPKCTTTITFTATKKPGA